MTPKQYYFPYLFNLENFNDNLHPFGLSSSITYDRETSIPDQLVICNPLTKKTLHSIPFGKAIMIEAGNLLYWETDTNLVDIVQISLQNLTEDPWVLNTKIDLSLFYTGRNPFVSNLDIEMLVTYARKDSIIYNQANAEKYAILIIEKEQVNIIPFDWFNNSNSEYDYTWPATARFDAINGKLYGQGIRMPDFCIDLDKAPL